MTEIINAFANIAPFLIHPSVLTGFVLMMVFFIHKQLLKAGLLTKLDKANSNRVVILMLCFGFALGVLIIFGLPSSQNLAERETKINNKTLETAAEIKQNPNNVEKFSSSAPTVKTASAKEIKPTKKTRSIPKALENHAETSSPNSPAIVGNGNTVNYQNPP